MWQDDPLDNDLWLVRRSALDRVNVGDDTAAMAVISRARRGDPVYLLNVADRPEGAPESLLDALRDQLSQPLDGFVYSMFGMPELRTRLHDWLAVQESWPDVPNWTTSVTWTGTGAALADLFRLAAERSTKPAAVLHPEPGWMYRQLALAAGVVPIGFRVRVDNRDGPTVADLREAIAQCSELGVDLAAVVVNPQHNPTGANWAPGAITDIGELCMQYNMIAIIDNAFHGMTLPGHTPTNAVTELSSLIATDQLFYVRSLSKQFACNSWTLGAVAGPERALADYSRRFRLVRDPPAGMRTQAAMAAWIATPDCDQFSEVRRQEIAANEKAAKAALTSIGIEPDRIVTHGGAPYLLVRCDLETAAPVLSQAIFDQCGVLFGTVTERDGQSWLKVWLGRSRSLFQNALSAWNPGRDLLPQ
ncbi:hypothetical protein CH275_16550 [Rhodococcus sp. 06-235-1A]|uniref:pyridoxal phosphate-dependent aminotransferase n=1 Tax=Rhodococcus sp. 06-235-1A TaxID=2022508 RepID=UPI000B9ADE1F|nr:pyridoxal phosphate-dependent aminotransferase [Rhodococcus sp. 06-235-1A]OZD03388.1 hypothetical protein CH275_16550 [Rhodococcus sp. 06-235-1A]